MYRKNKGVPGSELATYRHAHQKQACTLLYTCVACLLVLLVRQKQRFHHPTLRSTSVTLVVCIEKIKGCRVYNSRPTDMPIKSKRVHCCIHVSRGFFKIEINIKQETRPRGAGFRTRELFLDCLTVLNPCATPA